MGQPLVAVPGLLRTCLESSTTADRIRELASAETETETLRSISGQLNDSTVDSKHNCVQRTFFIVSFK